MTAVTIATPGPIEARRLVPVLAAILVDCVEGGASVSYLPPLAQRTAEDFYEGTAARVAEGGTILFVASLDGEAVGTVQLSPVPMPNQPHRAEVNKLLVHRRGRNRGVARALMPALEHRARALGRTLLCLDTTAGSTAERLYEKLGWQRLGVMPRHALLAPGVFSDTTFFWKDLTA
jgi:GNAT superfamily N-acetyltransferase